MNVPESSNWFQDGAFQDKLVALLINDPCTLQVCSALLTPDDFKPQKGMRDGQARWLVAERALEFWEKHREPLGRLVRADVLQYAAGIGMSGEKTVEIQEYLKKLNGIRLVAPDALSEKVVAFKGQLLQKSAIEELADLHASGQLTTEKWSEISQRVVSSNGHRVETVDYNATLEDRIARREADAQRARTPWTLIGPLDTILHRTVGPGELGLVLAPWKRGKSSFLLWLASAFALQRLNVLYVTLEDPRSVVEDRLDSIITEIPTNSLSKFPKTLRKRFARKSNMMNARIEIYDGTGTGVTVAQIERIILAARNRGFIPQALIVDYDEEIVTARKYPDKKAESDETYRGLRRLCARYRLIGWTAAQTQRATRHLKILTGDKVADDIGKVKKVACAISMGKGDWSEDSVYLWVAAHKTARMDVGCTIVSDLDRNLVYDRSATDKARRQHPGES